MERPLRWGCLASLAGKGDAQGDGGGGALWLGRVGPLEESLMATSSQCPLLPTVGVRHRDTWPGEALQDRGGQRGGEGGHPPSWEFTQAFLRATERVVPPICASASCLQKKRQLGFICEFKGDQNTAEPATGER